MSISAPMHKPLSKVKNVGWDMLANMNKIHLFEVRKDFKFWIEIFFHLPLLLSPYSNHVLPILLFVTAGRFCPSLQPSSSQQGFGVGFGNQTANATGARQTSCFSLAASRSRGLQRAVGFVSYSSGLFTQLSCSQSVSDRHLEL